MNKHSLEEQDLSILETLTQDLRELKQAFKSSSLNPLHSADQANRQLVLMLETRKDSEARKIQEQIAWPGPNIFKKLAVLAQTVTVKLPIPSTLVYLPKLRQSAHLFTDTLGVVRVVVGEAAQESFFANASPATSSPQFIHFAMECKIKLCYSREEAEQEYEECPYYNQRLQYFVQPASKQVSKVRLVLYKDKPAKTNILTASKSVSQESASDLGRFYVRFSDMRHSTLVQSQQRIPQLTALGKQVFVLVEQLLEKKLNTLVADCLKSHLQEWVLIGCEGYSAPGRKSVPKALNHTLATSVNDMSPVVHISPTRDCFQPDQSALERYKREEEERKERIRIENRSRELKQVMTSLKFRALHMPVNTESKLSKADPKSYLHLRSVSASGTVPYTILGLAPQNPESPLVSVIDYQAHQTKPYDRQRLDNLQFNSRPDLASNTVSKYVDLACTHISEMNASCQEAKARGVFRKHLEGILADVPIHTACRQLFRALPKDAALGRFFEGRSRSEIDGVSSRVVECLEPRVTGLSAAVRNAHEKLGITHADFNKFLQLLRTACENEQLSDDDIHVILERIRSFESDVVIK